MVPPGHTSYTYTPYKPGEKHVQLSAASACGTAVATAKYHVKQCSIVEPVLTVSAASVNPGATIQASLALPPGHSAKWEVRNGTASATTGSSIQIVAGTAGTVEIDAYVSRGKSCTVKVSATVNVAAACPIAEPQIQHPAVAAANSYFWFYIPALGAGETVSFDVHNAEVLYSDQQFLDLMTPATGSFSVDVIVTNGTCSRTFTRTFELTACSPTATVMAAGSGACADLRVAAEFTGTAPFQGYWSDGVYFYTNENRIERTVSVSGTYTLLYSAMRLNGTLIVSAQVGSSGPNRVHHRPIVDGGYYDTREARHGARGRRDGHPRARMVWPWRTHDRLRPGNAELQFTAEAPGNCRSAISSRRRRLRDLHFPVHGHVGQPDPARRAGRHRPAARHHHQPRFTSYRSKAQLARATHTLAGRTAPACSGSTAPPRTPVPPSSPMTCRTRAD